MKFRLSNADYTSFFRIVATPVTLLLTTAWSYRFESMFLLLVLVAISDFLDGYLARMEKTVSHFGAFLDFTADKVFIVSLLVVLSALGLVPLWMTLIIIAREFIVSGIRIFAATEGFPLHARFWGKLKTVFTFIAIGGVLVNQIFPAFPIPLYPIVYILLLIVVFLTIMSALDYLSLVWAYLKTKKGMSDKSR